MPPRLIAALVARLKAATGLRALFINRAADGLTNFTYQCDAAFLRLVGAAHGDVVRTDGFG